MHYYLFQVDIRAENPLPDLVLSTTDSALAYTILAHEKAQAPPWLAFVIRDVPDRVHEFCLAQVTASCPR